MRIKPSEELKADERTIEYLYDVPRQSTIVIEASGERLFFDHVDGAYSLCYNDAGETCHLGASTKVRVIGAWQEETPGGEIIETGS